MTVMPRAAPREGWILAGTLDATASRPALLDDVCGIPHLLRLACDLALSGATRIYIVWDLARALPDLSSVFADPRLATRATLELVTRAPSGADDDGVLILRADRLYHRDLPRTVAAAWRASDATIAKIEGAEHDAVFATDRTTAREIAERAPERGGISAVLARHTVTEAAPPYLGFTAAAPDRPALRRAERQLVWSLRKSADGIASKLLNRRISLPITWMIARTPVRPNHVTFIALLCAIAGGIVIARGGYTAGVVGMLLVELGSIIDGVDGELARLHFQFSNRGQWFDTIADDIANIAYASGVTISLHAAGVEWAAPLGVLALCAFAATQLTQYMLIRFVYRSGDLAAIPWAMQSTELLSSRGVAAFIPKLFKRDFVVTVMVVLAVLDRLDVVLLSFSTGALVFFAVFAVQFLRHRAELRAR